MNGKIIKEGDVINDSKLQKIYKNKILIKDLNTEKEIPLLGIKIITAVKNKKEKGYGN